MIFFQGIEMLNKIQDFFKKLAPKKKAPKGFRRINIHELITIDKTRLKPCSQMLLKTTEDYMAYAKIVEIDLEEDHWLANPSVRQQLISKKKI
jgi:hypothetical protein